MWLLAVLFLTSWMAFSAAVSAQETLPVPSPAESKSHPDNSPSTGSARDTRTNPVLACLRIPAALITEVASRDFTHTSSVDRVVLGTHSRGTAICYGHVSCEMREQSHAAEIVCRITGTVDSQTCGVNGPALISSAASTSYTATKSIIFDSRKLITHPAIVRASSRIRITDVGSSLPGIRGRIVSRVAERRAADSLAEAEAITSDLTVAELQQQIDQEFAQRIVSINRAIEGRLPILQAFAESEYKLSIRSQPEFIQLMFVRRDADPQMLQVPPALPLASKIVLWIPLPGSQGASEGDQASEQPRSQNNFKFSHNEQWLLDDPASFLPLWLTTAVSSVKAKLKQRAAPVDLLLHENWIGVQFGQVAMK